MNSWEYDGPLLAIVLTCGAALFSLYLVFLVYFSPTLGALSDPVEILILYTLGLRAVLLFSVPRLRKIPSQIKIGILAAESFALLIVIIFYIFTGDPGYNTLMGLILTAWLSAGIVVITPYSILEFMISMYKSKSITNFLVSLAAEFATVIFLANIALEITPPPSNLQQLGIDMLSAVRLQPGGGISGLSPSNFAVDSISVVIYFCSILYIVLRYRERGRSPSFPLVLMLFGTMLLFSWSAIALQSSLDILVSLSGPAIGISLALWVISRGKK